MKIRTFLFFVILINLFSCSDNDDDNQSENCLDFTFFEEYASANFEMGFSTWIYDQNLQAINNTYQFINNNSTIYSEQIDNSIPWGAWINNTAL